MTTLRPGKVRNPNAQGGYALLGIIAAVGITATTLLVTSLSATAIRNEQARQTNASLALAKQALIGRAAADDNRPGSLPCPDLNDDGNAETSCALAEEQLGRLPWRTLGLPDLRDADGERLWYAVSANFRDATGNLINSNTMGQISLQGATAATNAAAVVFAPGAPLGSQIRAAEQRNSASAYLEIAGPPSAYSLGGDAGTNDKVLVIVPADIFAVVQRRVVREVQAAFDAYFAANAKYPYSAQDTNQNCVYWNKLPSSGCTSVENLTSGFVPAAPEAVSGFAAYSGTATLLGAGSTDWFERNGWRAVLQYMVSAQCATSPPCAAGDISVTQNGVTHTNQKVLLTFNGVPSSNELETAKSQLAYGWQ